METLIVSHHRNQYHSRSRSHISNGFISSPPRAFKGINCRTFHSGTGILPPPSAFPPPARHPCSPRSEPPKQSRRSNPIPIVSKPIITEEHSFSSDDFNYSELWAGPAYTNSPPPSSLPIPKFSLREKRTVSLDLPSPQTGFIVHPTAKSAPASPTKEAMSSTSANGLFFSTAFATQNLRRILNLDMADD